MRNPELDIPITILLQLLPCLLFWYWIVSFEFPCETFGEFNSTHIKFWVDSNHIIVFIIVTTKANKKRKILKNLGRKDGVRQETNKIVIVPNIKY